MKFDFAIGNPPYQEENNGESNRMTPVYNYFMDAVYDVANTVELITPARFLFNAGGTPKAWNQKMLSDEHIKVLWHDPNSKGVFSNTDIKGGLAITYRDCKQNFGAIGVFTPYHELNGIMNKVKNSKDFVSLESIAFSHMAFRITDKVYEDFPEIRDRTCKGHTYNNMSSNIFERFPRMFHETKPNDKKTYMKMFGRLNGERAHRYIESVYVNEPVNLRSWKVYIPKVNGTGTLGETLSAPFVGEPFSGATETFMSIGSFDTDTEAKNCLKYIKTKFLRGLLSILKVTQDNPPSNWHYIPLQNFTDKSDINWNASISNIDKQLYKKYNLSQEEIDFIETNVKEME